MTSWETGSMLRSNKVNLINFNMNLFFICQVQINYNSTKNILTSSWIKSTQLCTGHVTSRLTSKVALSHDSYLTHHMIVFSRGKKGLPGRARADCGELNDVPSDWVSGFESSKFSLRSGDWTIDSSSRRFISFCFCRLGCLKKKIEEKTIGEAD